MTGKEEKDHNGQPTCCAPGDLSECVITTTEERDTTHSKPRAPKESRVPDEAKTDGQA